MAGGALADPDKKGTDTDSSRKVTDEEFAKLASAGGLAEVNLGRIAVQKAASAEVKQFGQRMVDDHGKSNKELLNLANKKGYTLASTMDQKHQALADKLATLPGASFDRAYMMHMVEDHKETVALFQAESKHGKDAQLKEFAAKTLPIIQEHLKQAQEIAGKQGGDKR